MKRLLYILAATALLITGYALGLSSTMIGKAGPTSQAGCQTFPETKQTVCGRFLTYWGEHGGLAQQGFPISAEFQEKSDLNGQVYTVQYFERAVFEKHPENPAPNDVLLSQLGTFRYKEKYGSGTPGAPPAPTAPTAVPPQTTFVELGDSVSRNGLVFTVIRLDRLPKRTDIAYTVKNVSAGPLTFVLANKDQRLLNASNQVLELDNPSGVATVTLQPGQQYSGGTSWNGVIPARDGHATYIVDNLMGMGNVQVNIPID